MSSRILHLTHTNIFCDSRILKEMHALLAYGFSVVGIGVNSNEGGALGKDVSILNLKLIELTCRQFNWLPRTVKHILCLLELVFKMVPVALKEKPHLVHCHDVVVLPVGIIVKLICGCKLIYDAHELESDRNGLSRIQSVFTFIFEKLVWKFIDGLITVSPSIDDWYLQKMGHVQSVVILNSPQSDINFLLPNNYLRGRFAIPDNRLIFVYVGLFVKGRGIDLLLDVFRSQEVKSHIVFLGHGDLASVISNIAANNSNIHIHSSVPHSEVVGVISSANFGVCLIEPISLSDYLSLPNKFFEYIFAGLPIIASDFPDIRKVIEYYNVGEFCELNVTDIVDKIVYLENNRKTYKFRDINQLGWRQQEIKLISFYENILQNRRGIN